jgi:hypothetical protein
MKGLFRWLAIVGAGVALLLISSFSQAATKSRAVRTTHKPRVLILEDSVGGSPSWEAHEARADGFAVTLATAGQWDSLTTKQFKRYRAIIIADDKGSGNISAIQAAINNEHIWGPAITGNVILAGSDPGYHADLTTNAQTYIARAIAYAAHVSGHTGFYFAGVYYSGGTPQHVGILDALKRNGFYWKDVNSDSIHIDPKVKGPHGLNDTIMSGWNSTAHRAFTKWPKKTFHVWAVGVDPAGDWTTSDNVTGWADFLVRGPI